MEWEEIAAAKKTSLLDLIPPPWRLSPAELPSVASLRNVTEYACNFLNWLEIEITNSSSTNILDKIRSREWTSVEVTRAFCHRASLAHQLVKWTNCLSEICFLAAQRRAQFLDEYLATNGRTIGPLHGLPVSLKDRFNIEGLESACGYASWLGEKKDSASEGTLVKALRQMGAVFFVKTNVPMSMLMGETSNNIIGVTINPYNRELSAGGASGGEGALLAMKGSPVGWGSDIAGSVRIPCSFNNLYGLRPSFGRLPASGLVTSLPGLPVADSVVGPMSQDLHSLSVMTEAMLDVSPWQEDIDVIEMPWREEVLQATRNRSCIPGERNGRLVFAILACDYTVNPHPPVQRAVKMVRQALLDQGYEVVDWDPPHHSIAADLLFRILGSTAGQEIRRAVDASGEPPMQQMQSWYDDLETEPSSTADFWDLCRRRKLYREAYNSYWQSSRERTNSKRYVDGVIMPVAPSAAVEPGLSGYYAYSGIVNLLDYTAVSFPVTFADKDQDRQRNGLEPLSEADEVIARMYRKDFFHGAPVGLQVMGRRFQEEKVLGLAEAIENALQEARPA
ncbi:amidase signature domain-containing protein [Calycina marina]|uniref:Amidase signature domain-containing protein n=1 Tax=Calycina marina TaxID=1763456 RepID=A0A9P7YXQ3_9HELO|nr:amidase signature domain-containing protein [Calycina marina]